MANNITADVSLNIKKLREQKGIDNDASFAKILGVSPQRLSAWKKRNTYDINIIVDCFPDVSLPWLLTGEGPMLVGQRTGERGPDEDEEGNWAKVKEAPGDGQPYYDVDFLGGYGEFVDHPEDARPEYFIDFKPYNRKGVFYVNLRGDSMAPEFNGGDLLALRPVEGWWDYLLLGKVYAIVTKQGQRTIKRLRKGPSSEAYQLEPINPAYDKQDIPKDQIAAVFEVLGGIRHYE